MQRILTKILLLFPIPVVMFVVSFLGDPANLFNNGSYETKVASILLAGKNAAGISNYDERLVQKEYADKTSKAKDVMVFGSSRAMQINSAMFTGKTFYNCSVSGATLEDMTAIYWRYHVKSHQPSLIIFSLEPFILNQNNGQIRWMSLSDDAFEMSKVLNTENCLPTPALVTITKSKKLLEAFSPSYFRQSLALLLSNKKEVLYPTDDNQGDLAIKVRDGSHSYDKKFRTKTRDAIEAEAVAFAKMNPVYSLGDFNVLAPEKVKMFEAFIKLLQRDNVEIEFFLPPYHPTAYDMIIASGKYKMVPEAESYFLKVARANKIRVYGSYDPKNVGLGPDDFFDGPHPKRAAVERIFKSERHI